MRHLILLSLLAAMTLPAGAAKRVNVAQLEGALGASIAAHKSDDAIARQIGGMELSERLTEVSLARLQGSACLRPARDAGPSVARRPVGVSRSSRIGVADNSRSGTTPPSNRCLRPRADTLHRRCRACRIFWRPEPSTATTTRPSRRPRVAGACARDCTWWTRRATKSRFATNAKISRRRRAPQCGGRNLA